MGTTYLSFVDHSKICILLASAIHHFYLALIVTHLDFLFIISEIDIPWGWNDFLIGKMIVGTNTLVR